MNFWHRLLNPHCPHCNECKSCETLSNQLDHERFEKEKLLNLIIEMNKPQVPVVEERKELPLPLMNRGWKVKKALLEAEDRRTAELNKKKIEEIKPIEDLEKQLGVEDAS